MWRMSVSPESPTGGPGVRVGAEPGSGRSRLRSSQCMGGSQSCGGGPAICNPRSQGGASEEGGHRHPREGRRWAGRGQGSQRVGQASRVEPGLRTLSLSSHTPIYNLGRIIPIRWWREGGLREAWAGSVALPLLPVWPGCRSLHLPSLGHFLAKQDQQRLL